MEQKKEQIFFTKEEQKIEQNEIGLSLFETALFNSRYINEGNNGIITRLDFNEISEELKNVLLKEQIEGKEEIAFKLLKIYQPGKGKKEFEMQKKVNALLENSSEKTAKVPTPLAFREVNIKYLPLIKQLKKWNFQLPKFKISKEVSEKCSLEEGYYDEAELNEEERQKLIELNVIFPEIKVEVLLMDYVAGKDLARILLEEVAKRHKDTEWFREEMKDLSFTELFERVSVALGFFRPGGKHFDMGMKIFEEEMVKAENVNKIINFLKKTGYKFNQKWLDKINNTIKVLHNHNIYHRDLHERNIIITPEDEVFLIDFGETIKTEEMSHQEIYENKMEGKKYVDDETIIKRYKPLITTSREDVERQREEYFNDLWLLEEQINNNKEWQNFLKEIESGNGDNQTLEIELEKAAISLVKNPSSDMRWDIKALGILKIAEKNKDLAKKFIELFLTNKNIPPFAYNKFIAIYKRI